MLSLDNTYSEEEVADFYRRIEKLLPNEKIPVVIEPKVDGVAVSLLYEKGACAMRRRAATERSATTSRKISARFARSRHELKGDAPRISGSARRSVHDKEGFAKLNAERSEAGLPVFANPRNSAAGSLKQLDPAMAAQASARRHSLWNGRCRRSELRNTRNYFRCSKNLGCRAASAGGWPNRSRRSCTRSTNSIRCGTISSTKRMARS